MLGAGARNHEVHEDHEANEQRCAYPLIATGSRLRVQSLERGADRLAGGQRYCGNGRFGVC